MVSLIRNTLLTLTGLCVLITAKALSVTDDSGHVLSVHKPVTRIVTLAPNLTDMVLAAGAGAYLIAVDKHSVAVSHDLPRLSTYPRINIESIFALKPDLILAWQGGNAAADLHNLQDLGLPVYYSQPVHLSNIARTIENIGKLARTTPIAKVRAKQFRQQLATLKQRYEHQKTLSVYLQVNQHPLLTISHQSYLNRLITLCGARNVFAHSIGASPRVELEAIINQDPAVIILLNPASPTESIHFWQAWPQLLAVKHHAVFAINDPALARPGPTLISATKSLCHLIRKGA